MNHRVQPTALSEKKYSILNKKKSCFNCNLYLRAPKNVDFFDSFSHSFVRSLVFILSSEGNLIFCLCTPLRMVLGRVVIENVNIYSDTIFYFDVMNCHNVLENSRGLAVACDIDQQMGGLNMTPIKTLEMNCI